MCYRPAAIRLIEQSGLDETAGMFGNSLQIAVEASAQVVERNPLGSADEEQDADAPMISHSLEVPLQLLVRLIPRSGHRI